MGLLKVKDEFSLRQTKHKQSMLSKSEIGIFKYQDQKEIYSAKLYIFHIYSDNYESLIKKLFQSFVFVQHFEVLVIYVYQLF